MTQKALITGATGLLGRQVVKAFEQGSWEVISTGYSRASSSILKLDLNSSSSISSILESTQPQVVVHCAANRFPDKCDNDPAGTRALNITASQTLASLCAAQGIFLIYISTDYVFPGRPGDAPYETSSPASPPNLYGETKYEGEKAVLGAYKDAGKEGWSVVLRVPVLYGQAESNGESAVNTLVDAVWKVQDEAGKGLKMDHWAIRYPTNTEDVGRVYISNLYLSKDPKSNLPTTLQFSSEDKYTKYEICEVFAEILGLPLDGMVANTEGNDPNASVQRPYDCHLSTKALKELGIDVQTQDFKAWWRWQVKAFRK